MTDKGIELSKTSQVKLHLESIKQLLSEGYKLPQIVIWLNKKNIEISLVTLRSYLFREGVTAKSLKKLSHEKVLDSEPIVKQESKKTIVSIEPKNVITDSVSLPEITSRTDFKKLNETSDIDIEPSAAMREEANRILGE